MSFLEPGGELLLPVPTFEMLERYSRLAGGTIREVPWPGETFPTDEVIAACSPSTSVVAIVSPNNPTGAAIDPVDFERIATKCRSALLLVDLAYTEFADVDLTGLALSFPSAVVVRTFSKAWGLAGIRCGYAVGMSETIDVLRRAGNPFPVTGPSIACAMAALNNGTADQIRYVSRVRVERELLANWMDENGLDAVRSQANFVFCRTGLANTIWKGLWEQGIAVRWFGHSHSARTCDGQSMGSHEIVGAATESLRITCPGDADEFQLLMNALNRVMRDLRERDRS
jgi:histidinol-phosphate aminotransferase